MLDFIHFNANGFSTLLAQGYENFGGSFDSPLEMGFYVFCITALNMIVLHLFFGHRFRGSMIRKILLSVLLVGEVFVFSHLMTGEHYTDLIHAPVAHLNLN